VINKYKGSPACILQREKSKLGRATYGLTRTPLDGFLFVITK